MRSVLLALLMLGSVTWAADGPRFLSVKKWTLSEVADGVFVDDLVVHNPASATDDYVEAPALAARSFNVTVSIFDTDSSTLQYEDSITTVTVSLLDSNKGSADPDLLNGTLTRTSNQGRVLFDDLRILRLGTFYLHFQPTLSLMTPFLSTDGEPAMTGRAWRGEDQDSATFHPADGMLVWYQLVLTEEPGTEPQVRNKPMRFVCSVQDGAGNILPDYVGNITVSLSTASLPSVAGNVLVGAKVLGNLTAPVNGGVAVFENVWTSSAGINWVLQFSAVGHEAVQDAFPTDTQPMAIVYSLAVTQYPSLSNTVPHQPMAFVVQVHDFYHKRQSGTFQVTAGLSHNPTSQSPTLGGTLSQTAVNGEAIFHDLTLDTIGGGYTLNFSAASFLGMLSTDILKVTESPSFSVCHALPLSGGENDAVESLGGVLTVSSKTIAIGDGTAAFRFEGFNVSRGARITGASVQFSPNATDSRACYSSIRCEASDDVIRFKEGMLDTISRRPKSSSFVPWLINADSKWEKSVRSDMTTTPDLTDILQKRVQSTTWERGNAVALHFTQMVHSPAARPVAAYDGGAHNAPVLFYAPGDYDSCAPGYEMQNESSTGQNESSGGGSQHCVACSAGMAGSGTALCETCQAGKSSAEASSFCYDCTPGFFSEAGRQCTLCAHGKSSALGSPACSVCVSGTYGVLNKQGPLCAPCPQGFRGLPVDGATSIDEACAECPPGMFQPDSGTTFCLNCSRGMFSQYPAATSCTDCPSDEYQDLNASTGCKRCIYGTANRLVYKFGTALANYTPARNSSCPPLDGYVESHETRYPNSSSVWLKCLPADACVAGGCSAGYVGATCGRCMSADEDPLRRGYYRLNRRCVQCPEKTGVQSLNVFAGYAIFGTAGAIALFLLSHHVDEITWMSACVTFFQEISLLSVFSDVWSDPVLYLLDWSSVIGFNIELYGVECTSPTGDTVTDPMEQDNAVLAQAYADRWAWQVCLPLMIFVYLHLIYCMVKILSSRLGKWAEFRAVDELDILAERDLRLALRSAAENLCNLEGLSKIKTVETVRGVLFSLQKVSKSHQLQSKWVLFSEPKYQLHVKNVEGATRLLELAGYSAQDDDGMYIHDLPDRDRVLRAMQVLDMVEETFEIEDDVLLGRDHTCLSITWKLFRDFFGENFDYWNDGTRASFSQTYCGYCAVECAKPRACGQCKAVWYCSLRCQARDWHGEPLVSADVDEDCRKGRSGYKEFRENWIQPEMFWPHRNECEAYKEGSCEKLYRVVNAWYRDRIKRRTEDKLGDEELDANDEFDEKGDQQLTARHSGEDRVHVDDIHLRDLQQQIASEDQWGEVYSGFTKERHPDAIDSDSDDAPSEDSDDEDEKRVHREKQQVQALKLLQLVDFDGSLPRAVRWSSSISDRRVRVFADGLVQVSMLLIMLCYMSTCVKALEPFDCWTYLEPASTANASNSSGGGGGVSYPRTVLRAEPSISCSSTDAAWSDLQMKAAGALVLFVVVPPFVLRRVLVTHRDQLEEESVFHRYGLLYVAFESDYQLSGEIALMMRRAVLAVVLGVSSTMPVFQLIAAFLVCLVALVIQQVTAPYADAQHDRLAMVSLMVIMLVMLCALLLMMEQSVESPSMDYDSVNAAVYAIFWSWGVFVTCCLAIVPLRLLWNNYQLRQKQRMFHNNKHAAAAAVAGNPLVEHALNVAEEAFDERTCSIVNSWISDYHRTDEELNTFARVVASLAEFGPQRDVLDKAPISVGQNLGRKIYVSKHVNLGAEGLVRVQELLGSQSANADTLDPVKYLFLSLYDLHRHNQEQCTASDGKSDPSAMRRLTTDLGVLQNGSRSIRNRFLVPRQFQEKAVRPLAAGKDKAAALSISTYSPQPHSMQSYERSVVTTGEAIEAYRLLSRVNSHWLRSGFAWLRTLSLMELSAFEKAAKKSESVREAMEMNTALSHMQAENLSDVDSDTVFD